MGRTLAELDDMPVKEYNEWIRYNANEPVGMVHALDYAQAHICAMWATKASVKDMLLFKPPEPPMEPETFIALLKGKGFKIKDDAIDRIKRANLKNKQ